MRPVWRRTRRRVGLQGESDAWGRCELVHSVLARDLWYIAVREQVLNCSEPPAAANKELLNQSRAEIQDGIEVLADAGLHLDAVAHLQRAERFILKASQTRSRFKQRFLVRKAVRQQEAARGLLVNEGLGEET